MNSAKPKELSVPTIGRDFIETLRSPWFRAVAKCQHVIQQATHQFAESRGLQHVNLPVTTGSISSPMGLGSDSLPVSIDLMGEKTYLADSMQFALEFGCRLSQCGTYYIMPSFRGEAPDKTHLCQFFHSEAEIIGGLDKVLLYVEDYIKYLCSQILNKLRVELETQSGNVNHLCSVIEKEGRLPKIRFSEVRRLFKDDPAYIRRVSTFAHALTREGELELIREFGPLVWILEPEHLSVPFYQAYTDSSRRYARAADLLFGPGEVVGAGERHFSAQDVCDALATHQVNTSDYDWYIRMREEMPLQTSGFGLGIERFLMWVFQHDSIQDFELLPRVNGVNLVP